MKEPLMPLPPTRSWLFAPGTDERKIDKALASPCDAVILDLEDAVASAEKPRARDVVRAAIAAHAGAGAPRVHVRVNDATTGLLIEDLRAVCAAGLSGVLLPKAEDGETVRLASRLIAEREAAEGLPAGAIGLVPMIESARGVLDAHAIAAADPRVRTLFFGAGDLTGDLGIPTANEGPHVLHGKIQTALAARAAGREPPVDTVYFDLADPDGLRADSVQARALGYQGKAVIHPAQIGIVNEVFTPSAAEIALAAKVVEAFREAEARGIGAIRVEGRLVDYAMVKNAEKTLAVARSLGLA
jgi:citrate lyase subunit beta / citryl-CoA lyase